VRVYVDLLPLKRLGQTRVTRALILLIEVHDQVFLKMARSNSDAVMRKVGTAEQMTRHEN